MTRRPDAPYPGYDVLDQWDTPSMDHITREVLTRRLTQVPERQFFSPQEWTLCTALCDAVIPQDARTDNRVEIVPWLDAALHGARGTGTRFADMPPLRDAWRKGLRALDAEARARHGGGFADLTAAQREAVLNDVDAGKTDPRHWGDLPPRRFFRQAVLKDIASIYYAHPAAQSEIGYGGAASPRGYVRLGAGQFDAWEAPPGRWPDREEEP